MNNLIASIKEKMNEKNEMLKQLEMWGSVKAEGIDVAQRSEEHTSELQSH